MKKGTITNINLKSPRIEEKDCYQKTRKNYKPSEVASVKKCFVFLILFISIISLSFSQEKIEFLAIPIHYDVKAELFPSEHRISVSATVTLIAKEDSLSKITLGYDKYFTMSSVLDENKKTLLFEENEKEGYKYITISLPFGTSLKKDNKFKLIFNYSGVIDTFVYDVNIISEQLIELGQATYWYPRELSYFNDFTYSLAITAPGDQTIVSSELHAPLERVEAVGSKRRWIFKKGEHSTWTIFLWASNQLKEYSKKEGIIRGKIYYVNANEKQIKAVFENIVSIFKTYNKLYGSYSDKESFTYFLSPRKGWSYVPGEIVIMPEDDIVSSIKEGNFTYNKYKYLAHEFGHLWWGKGVRAKSEEEYPNSDWITEGFAEYSSLLALEKAFGKEAIKSYLNDFNKSIIAVSKDMPVTKAIKNIRDKNWHVITYSKSAYILHMLRYIMGDKKFYAMMNTFFIENQGKEITTSDFFKYIERFGGDLSWFVDEWLLDTGLPQYKLTYSISEKSKDKVLVKGEIIQTAKLFKMPLEIGFYGDDRAEVVRIMVEGKESAFSVELDFLPQKIELDPEKKVLKREYQSTIKQ